jgi:hypothetical protein
MAGSDAPEEVDVVARAQGLLLLDGPVAVVSGLGGQVVRATAGGILVGDRIGDHHTLIAGGNIHADG